MTHHPLITDSVLEDLEEILQHSEIDLKQLVNQNIVITGASGFVGTWLTLSWVVAHRKLSGCGKLLLTSRNPKAIQEMANSIANTDSVDVISSDIRELTIPNGYSNGLIIHAATPASASLNHSDPMIMYKTITEGNQRVLTQARRLESKMLFLSSGAVYGKQPLTMDKIREDWVSDHLEEESYSAYHDGKRAAEEMNAIAANEWGTSIVTARLFAFIAPFLPFGTHFAAGNFMRDALRGSRVEINSGGGSIRSYQYATDLCSSLWALSARGKAGEKYNVGSDEAISIKELADAVVRNVKPSAKVLIHGYDTKDNVTRYVPSISKIGELGVRNFISIDEALQRTARWAGGVT